MTPDSETTLRRTNASRNSRKPPSDPIDRIAWEAEQRAVAKGQ